MLWVQKVPNINNTLEHQATTYFTTVSGALLCADTWNAPNCTLQGHVKMKGVLTPQFTIQGRKGNADRVSMASQVRFTKNIGGVSRILDGYIE